MAYKKVTGNAVLFCLAKHNQIRFVEFEFGVQIERTNVMHLELFCAATNCAAGILFEEVLANRGPMAGTRMAERMLALGGIDEVFDDGHKKARIARARGGV